MACPCFQEDYVAFCGASQFPYVPCIDEMERLCFRDGYAACPIFRNLKPTDLAATGTLTKAKGGDLFPRDDARSGKQLLLHNLHSFTFPASTCRRLTAMKFLCHRKN